jgi:hypothetical protein
VTLTTWRAVLARYRDEGNPNEQLMARMLIALSYADDPMVVRLFDMYASEILEAQP